MHEIDFKRIAHAALGQSLILLSRWLPGGKVDGREYKSLNPTRSDSKVGSFLVNLDSGKWGDFASDDSGLDLISLYAYLHGLKQLDAAKEVAAQMGMDLDKQVKQAPQEDTAKKKSEWIPVLPVPEDAGPYPVAHVVRGRPEMQWEYFDADGRLLGVVYRFVTSDGGKEVLPCVYARNSQSGKYAWRWMGFPVPRPLYGLYELAKNPDRPVLLVEGEKCADAGHELLKDDFVCVTWPGGSKAVDKIDWSPLAGRVIYAWADCDNQRDKQGEVLPEAKQPGMAAMLKIRDILGDQATFNLVDIPPPGDKPDGWDIADAIAEGMQADELRTFVDNTLQASPVADKKVIKINRSDRSGSDDGPPWSPRDLVWDGKKPAVCLSNVYDILEHDVSWRGILAYDEFSYRCIKLRPPPFVRGEAGEWTLDDDVQAAMWITRKYGFAPKESMVSIAVEALAKFHGFNPVKDYLRSVQWDGIPRLNDWITDFIGAPKSEYIWRVSRWFLIGMVARAMKPGVKFDYCLVLEGEQGRGKSSLFRVLGGDWFGDTDLDLHSKDSMSALRGKWLYEIAELGSLARSEATRQKSFFSREVDEFRPVYGSREIRCPRQLVFGGTTNEWEWNKDATGGRRFWPVDCSGEINIEGLAGVRDQLFAEAYQAYLSGERFWPTNEEQSKIFNPEQFKRGASDSYLDLIEVWVSEQYKEFCIADVAVMCLKIDAARLTRDIQVRIGNALRQLGCLRIEKRTNERSRFWYKAPAEMGSHRAPGRNDGDTGGHGIDF